MDLFALERGNAAVGNASVLACAAQLVGPFVHRFPEVAQARYLLGHAYLGLGRAADAVGEFQELIKTTPSNTLARYSLGVAQLQAGQPKDALKELEAVAAPMRSIPEYHLQRARNYLALGRGDDAVKAATRTPEGQRGDAPMAAARYWGLTQQEYYARADVWPLNPAGEVLVIIKPTLLSLPPNQYVTPTIWTGSEMRPATPL